MVHIFFTGLCFIFMTPDVLLSAYNMYFCLSSYSLEGTEEKFRNRESRPEDLQVIAELKDMVSERESLVKKLVVGKTVRVP